MILILKHQNTDLETAFDYNREIDFLDINKLISEMIYQMAMMVDYRVTDIQIDESDLFYSKLIRVLEGKLNVFTFSTKDNYDDPKNNECAADWSIRVLNIINC